MRESFSLAQNILCCSPKQRQLEQSRRGECYSATWGGRSTLARPQGTHAGQLPANTPIYSDTLQPLETLNFLQNQQLKVKGVLPSNI